MSSAAVVTNNDKTAEGLPDLVDVPDEWGDEEYYEHCTGRIRGSYPWSNETVCKQNEHSIQAKRWMRLTEQQQKDALKAVRKLLITPFLFQTITCPEKWLRWANMKDLMNFDLDAKRLPSGKLTREHFLTVRMMDHGLQQLYSMTEKKAKVQAIMKTMHYIRDAPSSAVDKAILDTKSNENVKILVDAIQTSNMTLNEEDKSFISSMDRVYFIALLCMRQFAEVVHIMTIEARDIVLEVQHKFSDHDYYLNLDLQNHREHGNELFKQNKFRDAVEVYTAAINIAPFHYLLYSNRCQALIRLHDFETALADAYRSIILKPDWGKGYHKLVTCLNEMGYLTEVNEYANRGIGQCPNEGDIVKSLKSISDNVEKRMKQMTEAPTSPIPVITEATPSEIINQNSKKKKAKTKKKKRIRSSVEAGQDKDSQSDSDQGEGDSNSSTQTAGNKNRRKESSSSQTKNNEQFQAREKYSGKIIDEDTEIMLEFEKWLEKGSTELLKNRFSDACKTYKLAIDLMESHKQIKGYNDNDFATLLYSRGLSSQQLGYPVEIDNSRRYFVRIINEYKTFSHVCMAYFAEARSTYLLNEFIEAKKKARNALRMVKKCPMRGFLAWPGTSENIPESDERLLRSEIRLLLQQCSVPPEPTATCIYQKCSSDYSRKQIYSTDLNFEGYFEVTCDWDCIVAFHLSCWPKFKHDVLTVSGDKEVLGIHCFTPDCGGVITCIKMFDENYDEKKRLITQKESCTVKTVKNKSKYSMRMPKSEINMRIFKAVREEKKRKRYYWKNPQELSNTPESKIKERFTVAVNDDRDVSQATIYVKNSFRNANQRRFSCRTVTPASLHKYCSSIPHYKSGLSVQSIDELIEKAKIDGFNFDIPDDVLEETEEFAQSFGEDINFIDDEKLRLPFIFVYFVWFFATNGPADVFDEVFSGQAALLPERFLRIVEKCGGLECFLRASPLFIRVGQFIGIHSQHSYMKGLIEEIEKKNAIPLMEPDQISPFVRDFYDTGVTLGESDIANITGAYNGNDYLDQIEPPIVKVSQNSETSSMYSLDDANEGKSEISSQTSVEIEKTTIPTPAVLTKKSVPIIIKQHHITKKQPTVKKTSKSTQTEGKDDPEKAKEAIQRLQERLLEMQDESTKHKKTSQATEEALAKKNDELKEKERVLRLENATLKQNAEAEASKFNQLKKQLLLTEAKLEQSKSKERSSETSLRSLTQGMQKDRDDHLREIAELRKSVGIKDKDLSALKRRAMLAEIELMRAKEAYHVGMHIQAKNHCEQGAREFEVELTRLANVLPEPVLHQFKMAQKMWVGNAAVCENSIETLKDAYSSIIEQINAGRALAELPPVPDIKPPPLGPNPRHMMIEYQRTGKVILSNGPAMSNGSGDTRRQNGFGFDGIQNLAGNAPKSSSAAPLPTLKKVQLHAGPSPPVTVQPPIGAELPKAPKKKSFVALVEKLSKNIPQLTKEQIEVCAQVVRNDNNGLTGLSYEEIEKRVRQMAQLEVNVLAAQHHQRITTPFTNSSVSPEQQSWCYGSSSYGLPRAAGDDDDAVCPICCDPLKDGHISTLECSHKFHYDCINKWMKKQRTCPNCRKFMADTSQFPSLSRATPPGLPGRHF